MCNECIDGLGNTLQINDWILSVRNETNQEVGCL